MRTTRLRFLQAILGAVVALVSAPAAAQGAPEVPTTPKPQVVPPRLDHFESAPYPAEAKRAGLEGSVVLRLTIDATGSVTEAEVVKPAGNGFDEAAREAALKFKWQPATIDGVPTAVRIEYEYRFTLEEVPAPAPATPQPPRSGALEGRLAISGAEVPLAGATVTITGPDGKARQITSDAEGRWTLPDLPPGEYTVEVSAPGFVSAKNTETVVAGEATEITYRVAEAVEGIEITVQGERPPREVTRRTIEQREIARVPGTGGDALRAIEALPGVARPPGGFAGLLIIRGSDPNDSVAFVDGSEVPLIYHFGGLFSVIPTEAIDRFDLYPSNFSARYGRYQGGLVEVALRSPNTTCNDPYMKPSERKGCYHGLVELDLLNTRFLVEGPIPRAKKWSFLAAGRRSWFDTWLKPTLEALDAGVSTSPVYWDYQLIVERKPSDESRLSFRAYGSDDQLELLIRDPFSEDPAFGGNIGLGTAFHQGQVLYEQQLDDDVKLTTMLSAGKTTFDFSISTFLFRLDLYPIVYRSEFAWRVSQGFTLNTGLDFQFAPYEVVVRAPPPPVSGEPEAGPFSSRPPIESREKSEAFRPAWYAEGELTPTPRSRLVPGVRLDYARDSGHADFSPRLNARYDLVSPELDGRDGEPARRTTVKGGVGVYHQPPDFQETSEDFGTPGIRSNRALHYALGVEQELTEQVELSVEGFYKDFTNLVSRAANDQGEFTYNNEGLGHVLGLETFLKYKPDDHFFGWIAYTLSRSVRQLDEDSPEFLFEFDQTHNLTVLGSYRLGRGWEVGGRFRVVSGTLYTPVLEASSVSSLYAADAGAYAPLQGKPFSERLPTIHQLDLRVDKRWQFEAWRLAAFLDVRNAYSNAAVEGLTYNFDYTQSTYSTSFPILPSLGVRGEF